MNIGIKILLVGLVLIGIILFIVLLYKLLSIYMVASMNLLKKIFYKNDD